MPSKRATSSATSSTNKAADVTPTKTSVDDNEANNDDIPTPTEAFDFEALAAIVYYMDDAAISKVLNLVNKMGKDYQQCLANWMGVNVHGDKVVISAFGKVAVEILLAYIKFVLFFSFHQSYCLP